MKLSAWCIRNPVAPTLLFFVLTLAGLLAFANLSLDENPNVDLPAVSVSVVMDGAAPEELEVQVAKKVEDAVQGVAGVKHIRTQLSEGLAYCEVEFRLETNPDRAVNDVRDAVSRIRQDLPEEAGEPQISRIDVAGGAVATYTIESTQLDELELSWLVDDLLARELVALPGVGKVQRLGGLSREISLRLEPLALRGYALSVEQVQQSLLLNQANFAGGRLNLDGRELSLRTLSSADSLEALKELPVGPVLLKDLGELVDGPAEPRQLALLDGRPVVAFSIYRSRGSSLVSVARAVERRLGHLSLPGSPKIQRIQSAETYVKDAYEASFEHLLLGALLAVAVIYLALKDWRAAFIAGLAMPLSLIPTFACFKLLGFTLNNMTLLALALVVGILVDDAIVEIENIVRHIQLGKPPYQAALEAADEIGLAVVATTASIMVVFLPVSFMSGIAGKFFREFGLSVALAVFFSLLVARLLTPLMAAHWLKRVDHPSGGYWMHLYGRVLQWALGHRGPTLLLSIGFFVQSVLLLGMLPQALVTPADRSELSLHVELPAGSSLDRVAGQVKAISRQLARHHEIDQVFAAIGAASTVGLETSQGSLHRADFTLQLVPPERRQLTQRQLEEQLRSELAVLPDLNAHFTASEGLSGRISLVLTSEDRDELDRAAATLQSQMRQLGEIYDVSSSAAQTRPEVVIRPDRRQMAEQQANAAGIARALRLATLGESDRLLARYPLEDRQLPIRALWNEGSRADWLAFAEMNLSGGRGKPIPLQQLVQFESGEGPAALARLDRRRQVTLSASPRQGVAAGDALAAVHRLPFFQHLPGQVQEVTSGDAEIQQEVFSGFAFAMVAAVVGIYAVLVLLYQSYLQPLVILVALPLSIGGAALALLLGSEPVGLYALIGLIMLMGLATKNSILMVDYILQARREGRSREQALLESGEARARPILMTTVAMVAGMLPIALGIGAGAEERRAMAVAVIGGLTTSTLLTLVVVPVVYASLDDLTKRWRSN